MYIKFKTIFKYKDAEQDKYGLGVTGPKTSIGGMHQVSALK